MITCNKLRCKTFIVLCQEIKERLDFNNKIWMLTQYSHSRQVMDLTARAYMPSVSDLVDELPRISNMFDKQVVGNEWRSVQLYKFPHHFKDLK